ncbi:MAG: hypothetical protein K0S63_1248 [Gammaproteobacteria bacterium]|nr:hypothetical protein [Gammaproteobacteria bacterium]
MKNLFVGSIVSLLCLSSNIVLAQSEDKQDLCLALTNSSYTSTVHFSGGVGGDPAYIVEPQQSRTLPKTAMRHACPYGPKDCYIEISLGGNSAIRTVPISAGARITYQGFYNNQYYYYIDPKANVRCVSK